MLRLLLLVALLAPVAADAAAQDGGGSVGVTPTRLDFGSVLRGEPVSRSFTIQNARDEPVAIRIEREGNLSQWITVEDDRFTVPANSTREVELVLKFPDDEPNGAREGAIVAVREATEDVPEGTSGAAVEIAFRVTVAATLGGEENVDAAARELYVPTVEEGMPVPASLVVVNTGNIRTAVDVRFAIEPYLAGPTLAWWNGTTVELRPGLESNESFRLAPDLEPGQYRLRAKVFLEERMIHEGERAFEVVREGQLTRQGEMPDLWVMDVQTRDRVHRLEAGRAWQLVAPFRNTGEVNVEGRFEGYVAYEGNVLSELESEFLLVAPGEEVEFRILVDDVVDLGRYVIAGRVHYSGKATPELETVLNILPPDLVPDLFEGAAESARRESPGPALALLVAAAWALAYALRK